MLLITSVLTSCLPQKEVTSIGSAVLPQKGDSTSKTGGDSGSTNPGNDGGSSGSTGGNSGAIAKYDFAYNSRFISNEEKQFVKGSYWDKNGVPGSVTPVSSTQVKVKLFTKVNQKENLEICSFFGIKKDGSSACDCEIIDTHDGRFLKVDQEALKGTFSVVVNTTECEPDGGGNEQNPPPATPDPMFSILLDYDCDPTNAKPSVTVQCGSGTQAIQRKLCLGANVHGEY